MIRFATIAAVVIGTFAMTTSAQAEGRVSYTADAGKMGRIEMSERWKDDALRMDIEGMDAYMLMRAGEIYSVSNAGGQIMVMPLSQLKGMAQSAGQSGPAQDQAGVVFPESITEMRDTGETREVAGITGRVFEVDWVDDKGTAQTDTAVLSDNSLLLEHQAAKIGFVRAISDNPPNPLLLEMYDRGLAALSFGDRFKVLAISDDAGADGNFVLPADPIDLGDMMNMGQE